MVVEPKTRTQRRLFRIPQATEYVGGVIKPATWRQWIWLGKIDCVRIGRAVCIPQDAIDALIDAGTVPARDAS